MTPVGGGCFAFWARGASSVTYEFKSSSLFGDGILPLPLPLPLFTVVPSIEGLGLYSGADIAVDICHGLV